MTPNGTIREPPQFLNTVFLSKALREGLELPTLQINSYRITPATAVGDNYLSLMFRVVMEVVKTPSAKPERLSVVCKTLPRGQRIEELVQQEGVSLFEKEANMLMKIMPDINRILTEALPQQEPLSAQCFWYGKEPEEVLILEDLKESGFALVDRLVPLMKKMIYYCLPLFKIKQDPKCTASFTIRHFTAWIKQKTLKQKTEKN